ncbi:extracellular solute-binding protein [Pectinatus brassicae]|uniref:Iron(III) transport system substrate-binding protein n=1 Tax=Pectinatus brassicae TaxID=862415 RepID=A0A840UJY7_9FIRM|nr:extracellular solute-binding protein [Pectinatus brassicae]MBB5335957.1 iron(III) transport system substrate-binding protein [Pectinatus brassicae]
MRRYAPLAFIVCSIILILLAINTYWIYHTAADNSQQIMMTRSKITVYSTLPSQLAADIAADYEKSNNVKVNFVLLSQKELIDKIKNNTESLNGQADVFLASKDVLEQAAVKNILMAFSSEQEDVILKKFKDKTGLWIGIWYDPIVFCANRDYLQNAPYIPKTWQQLADTQNLRIGMTDFVASDIASDLFYALIKQYGEKDAFAILHKMHPKVVQYAKYLSTPVRMAGMNEVDISVAVQSEAIRYLNNNYPLTIIYPEDGTYYQLTGTALLKNAPNKAEANRFIKWLMGNEVQFCLQKNGIFFVPTNYSTLAYKIYAGKNLQLFSDKEPLAEEEKDRLLDKWVKTIRLK